MEATQDTIPVQVTVRLRNAKMIEARKRLGYSQVALADIAGVSLNLVVRLEKFELPPSLFEYVSDNAFSSIAEVLSLKIADIAPPSLCGRSIVHTVRTVEDVESDKLLMLSGPQRRYVLPSPADVVERLEQGEIVRDAIATLSYRERGILKMSFGIGCDARHGYAEIGRHFKVSRQRVRQIEMEAMKKLENRLGRRKKSADREEDAMIEARDELRNWENTQ